MVTACNYKQVHHSFQVYHSLSITPMQKPANETVITVKKFTERLTPKIYFSFCSRVNFLFTFTKSDWFTFLAGSASELICIVTAS